MLAVINYYYDPWAGLSTILVSFLLNTANFRMKGYKMIYMLQPPQIYQDIIISVA